MRAVAISADFIDDNDTERTAPYSGLSEADVRCLRATLSVLEDPALAHPAAACSALLRWFASHDEPAVALTLAADWLRQVARDGVRAAVVDLGLCLDDRLYKALR